MPVQGFDYKVNERRLTCPFNKAHQVTDMQKHLTKCKSYDNAIGYSICPFNSTHYVLQPEYLHHLDTCEYRLSMERFMGQMRECDDRQQSVSTSSGGDLSQPLVWQQTNAVVNHVDGWGEGEDWATDNTSRSTYNPELATANRAIFRRPETHMGKSARNTFRQRMAEQLQQQLDDSGSTVSSVNQSSAASSAFTSNMLRRPRTDPSLGASSGSAPSLHINPLMKRGRGRGNPSADNSQTHN